MQWLDLFAREHVRVSVFPRSVLSRKRRVSYQMAIVIRLALGDM